MEIRHLRRQEASCDARNDRAVKCADQVLLDEIESLKVRRSALKKMGGPHYLDQQPLPPETTAPGTLTDGTLACETGSRKTMPTGTGSAPGTGIDNRPAIRKAHNLCPLGVCFSGGGIRSATLNLGVIQGLCKQELLPYIDYLLTVSGGGYIGARLHGVIRHNDGDPVKAQEVLEPGKTPGDAGDRARSES